MTSGITTFTLIHVALSLVGIFTGLVVAGGLVAGKRLDGWTSVFLATTVATSVTGFGFPFVTFLPSHAVAILSLVVLPVAIVARYVKHLAGAWRGIYVVGAVLARPDGPRADAEGAAILLDADARARALRLARIRGGQGIPRGDSGGCDAAGSVAEYQGGTVERGSRGNHRRTPRQYASYSPRNVRFSVGSSYQMTKR